MSIGYVLHSSKLLLDEELDANKIFKNVYTEPASNIHSIFNLKV